MEKDVHILIVDDEPDIRNLVRILLTGKGYQVTEAASGEAALELWSDEAFDLVILDIMMPGMDGVDACRRIREHSAVPILFLTAKTQITDKISAYESGGDDYLAKPFSRQELLMKVESLVRRYRVYRGKGQAPTQGPVALDEENRRALRNGEPVELTDKEYEILRFLMGSAGKVVDVRSLYEGVWGEKYLSSSNNTVMVHILNLRKKLEEDPGNPKFIRTIWGKGYQFG